MSEDLTTDATTTTDASPAETQTDPPGDGDSRPNREARYRVERNEARTERDALAARVEKLQLRDALRLAGEHLAQPDDLLALGEVTLADLLDDDGNVDPEVVAGAAAAVIESRPGLAKNPKVLATDFTQGTGSPAARREVGWGDFLHVRPEMSLVPHHLG